MFCWKSFVKVQVKQYLPMTLVMTLYYERNILFLQIAEEQKCVHMMKPYYGNHLKMQIFPMLQLVGVFLYHKY